jgi:hypothetical protein
MFYKRLFFCVLFLLFARMCVAQPATTLSRAPGAKSIVNRAATEAVRSDQGYDLRSPNRNFYNIGETKVVTVPAYDPRQAMLDAQTYHIGWVAVEARMGQSRVMPNVLLQKLPPYVPGTPPVTRPVKTDEPSSN